MKKLNIKYSLFGALTCILLASCSKMNDPIAEYVKNGEIIYSTRLDSLKAFPGNQKVKLTWLLPSNHSAVKSIAYWNGKAESREITLTKGSSDKYEFVLDNLPEASYLFEIFTYDKNGHASVKSEVSTVTYGERYRQGLLNRVYTKVSKVSGNFVINFALADIAQVGMEIEYTNISGVKIVTPTAGSVNEVIITGIDFSKPIRYRTIYRPGNIAIDTFASDWTTDIDISKL
ncbi:DUF4998 domain-containing protein [Pedobacter frigoris]|uniref:DUF4998 domain-containing protein n=1 Tax=Pedobacter frigoris TaxID=2571272 RepID=UPI00292F3902|nr:DUF4998 domain-containing protein [Pedobacter frigoris]